MLDHKYAYDFQDSKRKEYKTRSISETKFFDWSRENLYRTSYGGHWTNKP